MYDSPQLSQGLAQSERLVNVGGRKNKLASAAQVGVQARGREEEEGAREQRRGVLEK